MNNPFDYVPDKECEEAFCRLLARVENLRQSEKPEDINFCNELDAGKMLGVLIAEDDKGKHHTLYAFSGQLGERGFYFDGFVGPVFDYLDSEGYFKSIERDISNQNKDISIFEEGEFATVKREYEDAKKKSDLHIAEFIKVRREKKLERDARRSEGNISPEEADAMIRQSQFLKAELRRIKKKAESDLSSLSVKLNDAQSKLVQMKEKRRSDSEQLQNWLFDNFKVLNARGEAKSLSKLFADTSIGIPPSGAGECCGPKLLHAAYQRCLKPVWMAEYWYGRAKGGEVRMHAHPYPACRGKCLPILSWMLIGLDINPPLTEIYSIEPKSQPDIVFENQWFCVVNKPAGILSVPGKDTSLSVEHWLKQKYGSDQFLRPVHRLDQDTSGLLIIARNEISFTVMQSMFAMRKIRKTYLAELEGDYISLGIPKTGRIELPLSPDWLDRPRQLINLDNGKEAITDYEFVSCTDNRSRIIFRPLTGRTHQLRVHAASKMGLGMPIVGDRLYGMKETSDDGRLHLHAQKIEFIFPIDGQHYCFELPTPF